MSGAHAPDERLRRADALVFVRDLDAPELDEDARHHLCDVLRLTSGATVAASDGQGRWRACALEAGGHRARRARDATLAPGGPVITVAPLTPAVTVAFALVKGDRPEWTVQKLTELGVDEIVPLLTDRTVVVLDEAGQRRRGERLRRVAREAAAQSRRVQLPLVEDPLPLAAFAAGRGEHAAPAEPGGGAIGPETRCIVVGPEGGFSPGELALFPCAVGLGPTVLRAETAAIAAGVLLVAARARREHRPTGDGRRG